MKMVVEVDDNGDLRVPAGMLPGAAPHTRFQLEVREREVIISPASSSEKFWQTASSQERAADILKWAESHRDGPGLPDPAVTREGIYD